MTQNEKDLLLKDLCVRLSYGVILNCCNIVSETLTLIDYKGLVNNDYDIDEVKPYLFPISSMTDEQKEEYYSLADNVTIKPIPGRLGMKIHCIKLGISNNSHEEVWDYVDLDAIDWLNKNHFDYRGLIEKGLAIDATGLNIY